MTRPWTWTRGAVGFKNGKLYLGDNMDLLHFPKEETTNVYILRASDMRLWMIRLIRKHSAYGYPGPREEKIKISASRAQIPFVRILNFAKVEKEHSLERRKTPHLDFVTQVGEDNIRLALSCRGSKHQARKILQRILMIPGYKELLIRFPLAAKAMATYDIERCRRLIKLNDRELAGAINILKSGNTMARGQITERKPPLRPAKGHPISKAALKALKKVHRNSNLNLWDILPKWEKQLNKYKFHIRTLSLHVLKAIEIMEGLPSTISTSVIDDVQRVTNKINKKGNPSSEAQMLTDYLEDIDRLVKACIYHGETANLRMVRTASEVKDLHDELAIQVNHLNERNIEFPEPWIPGTEHIIPLTDSHSLKAEGIKMHHCCGGYKESVLRGNCYIYHVEEGDHKSTLELWKDSDGVCYIAQFRSACNRIVDKSLQDKVNLWLMKHNNQHPKGL